MFWRNRKLRERSVTDFPCTGIKGPRPPRALDMSNNNNITTDIYLFALRRYQSRERNFHLPITSTPQNTT